MIPVDEVQVHRTREILALSRCFNAALEEFSTVQVGCAPPPDIAAWTWEKHREVRRWAQGHTDQMPKVIADYLETIRGCR